MPHLSISWSWHCGKDCGQFDLLSIDYNLIPEEIPPRCWIGVKFICIYLTVEW